MKTHYYMGLHIHPCAVNGNGMRWHCLTGAGYLRADTLVGIKQLIKHHLRGAAA